MSDDAEALVFETELDAPPEKVWRAIATPEVREAWLGEPESGPAEVVRAEPPGRLDLVWPTREGDGLVSFEIEPADGGSHLTITHRARVNVVALAPRRTRVGAQGWRMAA
jgi:uncharacterized protein YndB with AHSA1/START domain